MAATQVILYLGTLDDQVLAVLPSTKHGGKKVVVTEDPESAPTGKFRVIRVITATVDEFDDLMAPPPSVDGVPISNEKRALVIDLTPGQQNVMDIGRELNIGSSNALQRAPNPKVGS